MSDIRIDTGFLDHVKTQKLRRIVGADGVICLIRLWTYAAEYRARGILYEMDADDIEIAAGWGGDSGQFIDALLKVRFIDDANGVFMLHNWKSRNPWAYGAEERSERARQAAKARWESKQDADGMQAACGAHAKGNAPSPFLTLPSPKEKSGEQVRLVFAHWQEVFKHPKAKLDSKRKKTIASALKNYSVDDLKQAIDGCSKTPHNIGHNDRGEVYDGLHIIFRDSENIERFIRNATNPPVGKSQVQPVAAYAEL